MTLTRFQKFGLLGIAAAASLGGFYLSEMSAQGRNLQTPAAQIDVKRDFNVPMADAQTDAIITAANAFLDTLNTEQRAAAVFDFADNTQRANWSNFPDGPVVRQGVMRGNMSETQLDALNTLLRTALSEEGYQNVLYQLAAEESLENGPSEPNFGDDFYYVSFLGEPALDVPWMFQFGGHHLAINVTVFGPDLSFSPMLTGGEPLRINMNDKAVYITEKETTAAAALIHSLSDAQKKEAIRSDKAINLLLGPGEFGTTLAPEGVKGSDLTDSQRALLMDVIKARLGFINADDFAAKMAVVGSQLDDTYFGWWGPEAPLGAAYFRVTGPSVVMEYAPQDLDADPTNHAHNMYRDPQNDYGTMWIAAE